MNAAVASAKEAFKTWSQTSVMGRQAIMFKYQELIKKHLKDIAGLITIEQGKTLPDAEGDVIRGLQVVEHCCSMTNLLLGETLPGLILDFLILGHCVKAGKIDNSLSSDTYCDKAAKFEEIFHFLGLLSLLSM